MAAGVKTVDVDVETVMMYEILMQDLLRTFGEDGDFEAGDSSRDWVVRHVENLVVGVMYYVVVNRGADGGGWIPILSGVVGSLAGMRLSYLDPDTRKANRQKKKAARAVLKEHAKLQRELEQAKAALKEGQKKHKPALKLAKQKAAERFKTFRRGNDVRGARRTANSSRLRTRMPISLGAAGVLGGLGVIAGLMVRGHLMDDLRQAQTVFSVMTWSVLYAKDARIIDGYPVQSGSAEEAG